MATSTQSSQGSSETSASVKRIIKYLESSVAIVKSMQDLPEPEIDKLELAASRLLFDLQSWSASHSTLPAILSQPPTQLSTYSNTSDEDDGLQAEEVSTSKRWRNRFQNFDKDDSKVAASRKRPKVNSDFEILVKSAEDERRRREEQEELQAEPLKIVNNKGKEPLQHSPQFHSWNSHSTLTSQAQAKKQKNGLEKLDSLNKMPGGSVDAVNSSIKSNMASHQNVTSRVAAAITANIRGGMASWLGVEDGSNHAGALTERQNQEVEEYFYVLERKEGHKGILQLRQMWETDNGFGHSSAASMPQLRRDEMVSVWHA